MRELVYLGPVPSDESCQQCGTRDYNTVKARKECNAFINQLRRQFGEEPEGARLSIKAENHDFGTYYEVVCYYSDEQSCEYAFRVENEYPQFWDVDAVMELASHGIDVQEMDRTS
jgi:hypothetical protein